MMQMLLLKSNEEETQDEKQGKMLLLTEYSLLSLLHDQSGVIHHHGFFKVNIAFCIINNFLRENLNGRILPVKNER